MNCPRCEIRDFKKTPRKDGVAHRPTEPVPDLETLEDWMLDGNCEATDGCTVEPDGTCPHGHLSWLRHLGLI